MELNFGSTIVTLLSVNVKITTFPNLYIPKTADYKSLFIDTHSYHCYFGSSNSDCFLAPEMDVLKGLSPCKDTTSYTMSVCTFKTTTACHRLCMKTQPTEVYEISEIRATSCYITIQTSKGNMDITLGSHAQISDTMELTPVGSCPTYPSFLVTERIDGKTFLLQHSDVVATNILNDPPIFNQNAKWDFSTRKIVVKSYSHAWQVEYPEPYNFSDYERVPAQGKVLGISSLNFYVISESKIPEVPTQSRMRTPCGQTMLSDIRLAASARNLYIKVTFRPALSNCNIPYRTNIGEAFTTLTKGVSYLPYSDWVSIGGKSWRDTSVRNPAYHVINSVIEKELVEDSSAFKFVDVVSDGYHQFTSWFVTKFTYFEKLLSYFLLILVCLNFPGLVFSKIGVIVMVAIVLYIQIAFVSALNIDPQLCHYAGNLVEEIAILDTITNNPLLKHWIIIFTLAYLYRRKNYMFYFQCILKFYILSTKSYTSLYVTIAIYYFSQLIDTAWFQLYVNYHLQAIDYRQTIVVEPTQLIKKYMCFFTSKMDFKSAYTIFEFPIRKVTTRDVMESLYTTAVSIKKKYIYKPPKYRKSVSMMKNLFFFESEYSLLRNYLSTLSEYEIQCIYFSKVTIAQRRPFDFECFNGRIPKHLKRNIEENLINISGEIITNEYTQN